MKRTLLVSLGLAMSVGSLTAVEVVDMPELSVQPADSISQSRTIDEVEVLGKRIALEKHVSPTLRLGQALIQVPQNIQVFNSKYLRERQITNVDEGMASLASGIMRIEHWGAYSRFNSRGSRLAAFRDGMNITTTWGPMTEDMAFVDRIEFVKGPAGFMMSNGEPAGIYNVVTKKPTGERKGEASLSYGSYDFYRATIDLDGVLDNSSKLLYRLNAYGQSNNSHRKYEFARRYGVAPVLSYRINPSTELTLQYMYQHLSASNTGGPYVFTPKGFGSLSREATLLEPGLTPTVYNDHYILARLNHQLSKRWSLSAQASWSLSLKEGESMWYHTDKTWTKAIDADGNMMRVVNTADAKVDMKFGQVYLNGREQTGKVSHTILAGLDLGDKHSWHDWHQRHQLDTYDKPYNVFTGKNNGKPANGYPKFDRTTALETRADATQIIQSFVGVYVQDQIGFFNDALRLTLAGRYTDVKDSSYGTTVTHEYHFSPRIGLSYSIDKATSVYALYDQSFSPVMGRTRTSDKLKPITGNNYEIGAKRDWFGGRLSTSLTAYLMYRNNETASDPTNGVGESYMVQVGQSIARGVELDVNGEILPELRFEGNYAFTDYYVNKSIQASRPKGMRMPGYAKHTVNAWLHYSLPLGFRVGLGYAGLIKRAGWTFTTMTSNQPSLPDYTRFDARLGWEGKHLMIGLNVNNLADKHLYSGRTYEDFSYQQSEAGRSFRLNVTYKF